MASVKEELAEWMEHYLRNRDLLLKQITAFEKNKDGWDIVVQKGAAMLYVLVLPELTGDASLLEKLRGKTVNLVVPNTLANVQSLITNWNAIAAVPGLTLLFVNPRSRNDMRWMIMPHVHDKITEKAALKTGLMSLFETVEPYG